MATATARNVDDRDYSAIVAGANENGRSVSEELRLLIAEYARRRRGKELVAELREFRAANPIKIRPGEDAVSLIRYIRDHE